MSKLSSNPKTRVQIQRNGLEDKAWPLSADEINNQGSKKFWFTTEIHTSFQYTGNETFLFSGDDDVHVYINERLAIDLGGLHSSRSASILLRDYAMELNLTVDGVYSFDMFHAERQTTASNCTWILTISYSLYLRVFSREGITEVYFVP
jgi:fibro-slime domain-containing protein